MKKFKVLIGFIGIVFFNLNTFGTSIEPIMDSIEIKKLLIEFRSQPWSLEMVGKYETLVIAADAIGYKVGAAKAHLWLGSNAVERGYIDKAVGHYKILEDLSAEIKDSSLLVRANLSYSFLYMAIEELDKAKDKILIAKPIAEATQQTSMLAIIENSLGVLAGKNENYEESVNYFLAAEKIFLSMNDLTGVNGAKYNIAETRVKQGQPKLAIQPAFDNLTYTKNLDTPLEIAYSYQLISKVYSALENHEKAVIYADSSLAITKKKDFNFLNLETYPILYKAHEKMGNMDMALMYFQEFHKADKEFHDEKAKNTLAELEVQYETTKKEKALLVTKNENEILVKDAKMKNILFCVLLGGLLLLGMSAYFYFSKLRANTRTKAAKQKLTLSELKNKELEAINLQTQLSNKEADLTNLALDISRKNEYSNQIIEKLESLPEVKSPELHAQLKDLQNYASGHIQINNDVAVLQENVDKVNQEFYGRLEAKFGQLTTNEKYLTGLIRLNLANKEIASIKGISTSSVKTSRHRLRKRFELEPSVDIVDFLQKI